MVNSHEGRKPSSSWTRHPGRPRRTWLNLVQEDANAIPLSSLWRTEIFRGHGAAQRSVRTTRWWWLLFWTPFQSTLNSVRLPLLDAYWGLTEALMTDAALVSLSSVAVPLLLLLLPLLLAVSSPQPLSASWSAGTCLSPASTVTWPDVQLYCTQYEHYISADKRKLCLDKITKLCCILTCGAEIK